MKCRDARRAIHEELDGGLGADGRFGLEWHLEGCLSCRAYREQMRQVREKLAAMAKVKAPTQLVFTLRAKVRFQARRPLPSWFADSPLALMNIRRMAMGRIAAAVAPLVLMALTFTALSLNRPQLITEVLGGSDDGFFGNSYLVTEPVHFSSPGLDRDFMSRLAEADVLSPDADHLDFAAHITPQGEVALLGAVPNDGRDEKILHILRSAVTAVPPGEGRPASRVMVLSVERVRA